MTLSQALNARIRQLLVQEGWSQREFADRLGVTQGAVSYMLAEKRRASALDYYERLAKIFGVPLSILVADLEQHVEAGDEGMARVEVLYGTTPAAPLLDVNTLHALLHALILDGAEHVARQRRDAVLAGGLGQRVGPHRFAVRADDGDELVFPLLLRGEPLLAQRRRLRLRP